MNMGQDRQMQMIGGNGGNQFMQYAWQNAGNPAGYNDVIGNQVNQNAVQNPRVQNDSSVKQGGEIVEQHPANFEETRALYEPLYQSLAIKVEKVNSVNRKLKETNADMTTELA
nr:hypothetical protein [Tanacetum cinerariifolium]